jgi:hypothetical protein
MRNPSGVRSAPVEAPPSIARTVDRFLDRHGRDALVTRGRPVDGARLAWWERRFDVPIPSDYADFVTRYGALRIQTPRAVGADRDRGSPMCEDLTLFGEDLEDGGPLSFDHGLHIVTRAEGGAPRGFLPLVRRGDAANTIYGVDPRGVFGAYRRGGVTPHARSLDAEVRGSVDELARRLDPTG